MARRCSDVLGDTVGRFRVYALGGVRFVDIDDPKIGDVEELFRQASRAGYVAGMAQEEERSVKVLIPARGIGLITDGPE